MYKIAIFSGKGGTGKTSICSSLAITFSKKMKILAVDCDVDAPNLAILLGAKDFSWEDVETSEKAELIEGKCKGRKKCIEICNFGAISWNGRPIFNRLLCEGCGACSIVCPEKAIRLVRVKNGRIGYAKTKYGFYLVSGKLKIGESGSGKIVSLVKEKADEIAKSENAEVILIDSAAGIGCPVISFLQGCNFAIGVTEPTPSAFQDLKRAMKVAQHFKIPCGIVINKFNLNEKLSDEIVEFAKKRKVPILSKIPYTEKFVDALVNGVPIVVYDEKFVNYFEEIFKFLQQFLQ